MTTLATKTRRKCFISYHHADEIEVAQFIQTFDHNQDVLIARGIGASMSGDIINSTNDDYIMRKIRENYLRDTSVTIVMIGKETWKRKFVDWEIAASLRNTPQVSASGLLAITLPSVAAYADRQLPYRLKDNIQGKDGTEGYARWWRYPSNSDTLAELIEIAYSNRTKKDYLRNNSRPLRQRNA
ncbi:TIR domain-containing protein [Actinomyces naeslundii]|uniref:TIR domain-containing protein n=1 Tax=Actinomyces naeslundii TaxID=1655 RepID=UPI00096C1E5F|nr:TIR domain-containing protein [Actinomyces naeslundii]OMG24172.1 hypothetical protein BKH37_01420 [Actinomyces naeslundii]